MLFAQLSEHATDPEAWSKLADKIGIGGLFGVLILITVALAGWLAYRATIGPQGFVRVIAEDLHQQFLAFLAKLEGSIDELKASVKTDRQYAEDLRSCGEQFATAVEAIAKEVGADVEHNVAEIEATLKPKDQ